MSSSNSRLSRRRFLGTSAAAGTALMLSSTSRVFGANENVQMAVVGVNGRGGAHTSAFSKISGSRLVGICDVDSKVLAGHAEGLAKKNVNVQTFDDIRRLLDSKDVDAIAVSAPNHWHSLATIWACQAGKDVYVEKPISHNIFEGRKCVEAQKKYNRVVMHGTQRRSDHQYYEAFDWVKKGGLGAIKWVKGFCYKPRPSIGKVDKPTPIPPNVNYDLWCGPAPMAPLMRKKLHYDWHWVWPTGNGDIGNQGVHEMDMCRWFLGNNELPPMVMSIGGRFGYDDDATTPNTMISYYDYKPTPFIFEVRGLPRKSGENAMDAFGRLIRIGIWVQCEDGYYAVGESGGGAYDKDGKKVKQFVQQSKEGDHQSTFIKAVKSRRDEDNPCPAETAHYSAALCHLGNISYRCGKENNAGDIADAIKGNVQASEAFERMKEHLVNNKVDLKTTPIILGPALALDQKAERFSGDFAEKANTYVNDGDRGYRKPYVVPENV
jgi:predicted dehydrogenase